MPASAPEHEGAERVKLWDPLLRGFHWLLAACVLFSWIMGEFGPANMWLHFWSGYVVIALLAFRLVWGLVGPEPARFTHFIAGPRSLADYAAHLRARRPSYWPGHNPLGGWSVIAMLAVLAGQVASGLVADPDDYINVGPLASYVDASTRKAAVGWHHTGATLILILVGLHISAILYYRIWKREDLVRPMLTGWKWVRRDRG